MDSLLRSLWSSVRSLGADALDAIFPPRDAENVVRAARTADALALSVPLRTRIGTLDIVSIARFRTPLMRALVHEAKYRASDKAQALLGQLLAQFLRDAKVGSAILAPIPLSKTRFRERGFNQCEVIARRALAERAQNSSASKGPILATDILARVRDTEHQTALTRAGRRANVAGAFEVLAARRPLDPSLTYIVFDDVFTTGATLEAAEAALRAAGAVHVKALTLAN